MENILRGLIGHEIPSITGRVRYAVAEVVPNQRVILNTPTRLTSPTSLLLWESIERVWMAAQAGRPVDTVMVDEVLNNPNNWDSSTMCALVLAMQQVDGA
jgi:hypothetical protein